MIADSEGTANVLVITSNDANSTNSLVRGMKDELSARCPDCEAQFVDVAIPDWAREIRGEVSSALVRDPEIDYVIPIYDSMSQYVVPAIKASGRADEIKIATFNGTPFVLDLVRDEDIVQMDVGENLSWIGWASMDQVFRLIAGEQRRQVGAHAPEGVRRRQRRRGRRAARVRPGVWPGIRRGLQAAVAGGRLTPALAARHISKSFGAQRALDDVGLTVEAGEVHGLVGENGSGKSTLIRILAGYHAPAEGGRLEVAGRPVALPLRPGEFRDLGMSFVHQDLGLIPSLSVVENLWLNELSTEWRLRLSWREERRRARDALARLGIDLDPRAAGAGPASHRAGPARGRARGRGAPGGGGGLLVLDEPTAFLPDAERRRVVELVRKVGRRGRGGPVRLP